MRNLLAALILIAGVFIAGAQGAILTDDFETWVSSSGPWDRITSVATVSTTTEQSRNGSNSLKCLEKSTTAATACVSKDISSFSSYYSRFYFYLPGGFYGGLGNGQYITLFRIKSSGSRELVFCAYKSSAFGNGMLLQVNISNDGVYPSDLLQENTWYCMEILTPEPTSSSKIRWWLNGTEMRSFNTYLSDAGNWSVVEFGIVSEYNVSIITGTVYMDDVVISTSYVGPVGFDTDATGPAKIVQVRDGLSPTSDIQYIGALTQLSANWDATTDPESGIVKYLYSAGTTPGGSDTIAQTDNGLNLSVTVTGLSLTVGVTYYINVQAQNGKGLLSNVTSSDGQLMLLTPPAVYNVGYTNLTKTGVTITWTTDEPATSQVLYGLTTVYDSSTTENTALATGHVVTLSNLTPGTTYYFKVKSKDSLGTPSESQDGYFVTQALVEIVVETPRIAYPNPFRANGTNKMKFSIHGTEGGTFKILTIRNKLVKKLTAVPGQSLVEWDGTSENGQEIESDIYLYYSEDELGIDKGKFILIRE